jgi:hypothetical protein
VARIWLEEGGIVPGDSVGEFLKLPAIKRSGRQDGPIGVQVDSALLRGVGLHHKVFVSRVSRNGFSHRQWLIV